MQIENDYDKEVYNGDIGYVDDVDPDEGELTARFDGRVLSQRPRRSSLFIAWRGQVAENRACFAVNLNSELPNAGAFPAIAGVPGVRSPRARCKGEFGGNREFFAITASIQGDCSELPTKMKKLSLFINGF